MAATLSSSVGVYGSVFEFTESNAIPGKEEYMDSEKHQIRDWDWQKQNKIMTLIGLINKCRHENKSLQQTNNIAFCDTDNDQILAYYKHDDNFENETLMVVNLDPYYSKQANLKLPLDKFGINAGHNIVITDLITGNSYNWH